MSTRAGAAPLDSGWTGFLEFFAAGAGAGFGEFFAGAAGAFLAAGAGLEGLAGGGAFFAGAGFLETGFGAGFLAAGFLAAGLGAGFLAAGFLETGLGAGFLAGFWGLDGLEGFAAFFAPAGDFLAGLADFLDGDLGLVFKLFGF